jgi:hypothetical protein
MFAATVELNNSKGLRRARLAVIDDPSADSFQQFLLANVEPGAHIITDGWSAYPKATRGLNMLKATSVNAPDHPAHEALPAVHPVFSLVKRW